MEKLHIESVSSTRDSPVRLIDKRKFRESVNFSRCDVGIYA